MSKFTWTNRKFSTAVVLVLAAVLIGLAVLQYRWSAEMSVANSDRMAMELEASLLRLREDLHIEVAGICLRLQVDPTDFNQRAPPALCAAIRILAQDGTASGRGQQCCLAGK